MEYSESYSFTISTIAVIASLVFLILPDKINRISNHFWDRWRHKYVVNLHETQQTSKLSIKRGKGTETILENRH